MQSVLSKELEYATYDINHPQLKFRRVNTITGGETLNMSVSGGESSIFELNDGISGVYNLSKSFIEFSVNVPLSGGLYTNCVADTFPFFRSIYLETRSGLYMCEINDLGEYLKMVLPYNLSIDEFLNLPVHNNGAGWGALIQRSNQLGINNPYPYSNSNSINESVNFEAPLHLIQSAVGASLVLNIRFPLGLIKESIFALDKDICFNDIIRIRAIWNSRDKAFWTSTDSDPTSGPAPIAEVPAVSSLRLYMAVESNLNIISGLQEKVKSSGLQLLIPYPRQDKLTSAGTSQNPSIRYTPQDGKRLQKVYYSMFPASNTLNVSYENSNILATANSARRVSEFYINLDGVRSCDYNYLVANEDDFYSIRNKFKNSYLISPDQYYKNWTYCMDFTAGNQLKNPSVDPMNVEDGLVLNAPRRIDFYDTMIATNSDQHYMYTILQRKLIITPQSGIIFEGSGQVSGF